MKKKFLVPLSAAIAALSSTSNAMIPSAQKDIDRSTAPSQPTTMTSANTLKVIESITSSGDVFKFILERTENNQVMAYHQSHSSHSSHSSHRSHYSGR